MSSYTYKGNNDFRGYIAANYAPLLGFVGNDGGVNWNKLNKAGGVDVGAGKHTGFGGSYLPQGVAELVSEIYRDWQTMYMNDLESRANAALQAQLEAQPRLPQFDYSANYAKAQKQAASTVNPVYQAKLNRYLEGKKLRISHQKENTARTKQDIDTGLAQTIEDILLGRSRTEEDAANKLGDITATENSWQRQEGRAFDQARTALLGGVANAGLTESGLGQGQVQNAVTDRNLASEDQVREFDTQKRDVEIFRTRTLADLDTTESRAKSGATRRKESEDVALRQFIEMENFEEKKFRAENELARVMEINRATESAYQKIISQTIDSLVKSGARPQDIALFKEIYR